MLTPRNTLGASSGLESNIDHEIVSNLLEVVLQLLDRQTGGHPQLGRRAKKTIPRHRCRNTLGLKLLDVDLPVGQHVTDFSYDPRPIASNDF